MSKRQLSRAEQEFIKANYENMTPAELCEDMPGIGPKTVEQFIETSVMTKAKQDETPEERQTEINKKRGLTAGKLMGRDPARGIAVMTEGASELSDARRTVNVPTNDDVARKQSDRIHIIDPANKVR